MKGKNYYKWHGVIDHSINNYVIFRNVIQDLIESKHVRFPNKNETMGIDENPFPLINTLSTNMMTIANDILLSQGITFVTVATNELFDALVADQILRFTAVNNHMILKDYVDGIWLQVILLINVQTLRDLLEAE